MDDKRNMLEQQLIEMLSEGEMKTDDPKESAVKRIHPKYVMRIQTEKDPVREETELYRQMAKEVDDRYDKRLETQKRGKLE
ncbi:hypothetical protein [Paenibacillus contaminans]|uniref:Uncharacterized protein n=1 Tax=Paenibacillus contaminans TaxID=450362 RepID=A0A329MPF7_9BACL|nr:hypothetical protein [Paenibacillus contaminans]RAV19797.1 hypothetical protein DQG23_17805 [Paenibacillus contaminans]